MDAPNVDNAPKYIEEASSLEVYKYAEKNQPVIKAAEYRIKSAEHSIQVAKGALMPTFTMSAGYYTNYSSIATKTSFDQKAVPVRNSTPTYYYDNGSNVPNVYGYSLPSSAIISENISYGSQLTNNLRSSIQFNISVPIFSGFSARNTLANAIITRKNADLNRDAAKNTLRQTIEQSYLNARLSSRQFAATQKQVSSLKESFRVNEQRFNVGAMNSVDYNLSKTNLNKAETDLIRAKYDYILKTKVLEFYEGKELNL